MGLKGCGLLVFAATPKAVEAIPSRAIRTRILLDEPAATHSLPPTLGFPRKPLA